MDSPPHSTTRMTGPRRKLAFTIGLAASMLPAACGGEREAAAPDEPADAHMANAADAAGPLSKYVGSHPSETVDGTRFLDEPAVRAAVAANVPRAEVRDFVFDYDGPDAPIVARDGRILAWGCERHNCGYHNWSVLITPDGASAQVCYYRDDDDADGSATWFLPGGRTETRAGNCPSE